MSELANSLLDAIATGNQEEMSARFSAAMNDKINDTLQARKVELAQRIYGDVQAKQEAETDDDAGTTETETVASENGSEEV